MLPDYTVTKHSKILHACENDSNKHLSIHEFISKYYFLSYVHGQVKFLFLLQM